MVEEAEEAMGKGSLEKGAGAGGYHYKSPEELGSGQREGIPLFFRSRGNLILLLDLLLLAFIFIFLSYAGVAEFWKREEPTKIGYLSDPALYKELEFHALLEGGGTPATRSADASADAIAAALYLNVTNRGGQPILLQIPSPQAPRHSPQEGQGSYRSYLRKGHIQFQADRGLFIIELELAPRLIAPGERAIFRQDLQLPYPELLKRAPKLWLQFSDSSVDLLLR